MVVAPREYKGSLEERAQEALILFHAGDEARPATEDLILKIRVEGDAASFAWVVALPNEPTTVPRTASCSRSCTATSSVARRATREGPAKAEGTGQGGRRPRRRRSR